MQYTQFLNVIYAVAFVGKFEDVEFHNIRIFLEPRFGFKSPLGEPRFPNLNVRIS